jgi:hypothetical protein
VTRPNFIVVGAGRSGTTSLHNYLGQHPDIFMCTAKSPNFFASEIPQPRWETATARAMGAQWVSDPATYGAMFDGAEGATAVGEVSPVYLQALDVAPRIAAACGDVRIIAVLRNPVDRACAHFVGRQRDGIEPPEAVMADRMDELLAAGLPDDVAFGHYPGCGRYHHFLTPYIETFGVDRVHVALHEDLLGDPLAVLAAMFDFLGVDPGFEPDVSARLNTTGQIHNPILRRLWTRSVRLRTSLRPHLPAPLRRSVGRAFLADLDRHAIDPALRQRLRDVLIDDITALEGLIGRDLSEWKDLPPVQPATAGSAGPS